MPSNNYSTIQGLNIIYPSQDEPTSSESKDFLTPPSEYPDFTAQLDLWTNLSFSSDEPTLINDPSREPLDFRNSSVDMDKDPQSVLIANADKLSSSIHLGAPSPTPAVVPPSNFDISSFLAGFGIDPFVVPPHPSSPQFNQFSNSITNISTPEAEAQQVQRTSKRQRTRKQSVTSAATPVASRLASSLVTTAPSSSAGSPPSSTTSVLPGGSTTEGSEESANSNAANLSATEDKRRRNTAASARFRAKKKEREQAMEKRSKELESRVNELERECEGLRRENGWLKGLVVGVTSGNPVPIPTVDEPSLLNSPASASPSTTIPAIATTTTASQDSAKKRKRESTHEP